MDLGPLDYSFLFGAFFVPRRRANGAQPRRRLPSERFLYQLVGPLVLVLIVASVVFWSDPRSHTRGNVAWLISYGGTFLVLIGNVLWAVFDSRRRWPGVPAFTRFARIVTFYRE